jgi:putative transcriptional regulator
MSASATRHVFELLPELVLGTLDPSERAEVEAHLGECAACAAERDVTAELCADLALGEPPAPPPPGLWDRILASTGRENRFSDFVERVAGFLDVAADRARAYLDVLDQPPGEGSVWQPLPFAGYSFFVPETGPQLAGSQVGFLRIEPGARFPYHVHRGHEEVLILQGGFVDEQSGHEWGPGDIQPMADGTAHSYVGAPGPVCLCIGRVLGGSFEIIPPPDENK